MNQERNQKKLELQKQIQAIEAEEAQEAANARAKRDLFLENNLDHLLALVPDHCRTSCSDDNPANAYGRCTRCTLLKMQHSWGNSWDSDYDVELHLIRRHNN